MNLLEKLRWHFQYHSRRLRFALRGKELICSHCHRPLGKFVVLVRDGKISLEGLEEHGVYVDFESVNVVSFRHTDQSECEAFKRS